MLGGSASLCTRPWTPPQPNRKSLSSSLLCDYEHNHHYNHDAQVNLGQHFHFHHKHNKLKLRSMKREGGASAAGGTNSPDDDLQRKKGFWEIDKSKLAKLGLAAVLAYGLIDAVTYTSFFVLAFLGYEKSTGQNPAANLQALLGIVILMWTGNNVTRPFRVAGAAVLAPFIDEGLKKVQDRFKFRKLVYAFALVVSMVAAACLVVVGLLVLSRWPKPKMT